MQTQNLHLDIETYSSVSLKDCGIHKYAESEDFEILMIAYAFDNEPTQIVSLAEGEEIPKRLKEGFFNTKVNKLAHNAVFERLCFRAFGIDIPIDQWHCTMVKSAYCGLPLSLDGVSKALELGDDSKSATGKALIKHFCVPCKPTKVNGGRTRNLWHHNPDKWEEFKRYCVQDVEAERAVDKKLRFYPIPLWEREIYILDQKINDMGIQIDTKYVKNAIQIYNDHKSDTLQRIKEITKLDNPNSLPQLKAWLKEITGVEVDSLAKDKIQPIIDSAKDKRVIEVLNLRKRISKSSVAKYKKMLDCVDKNGVARGILQYYGAFRTGRWAGRRIQPQNVPRIYLKDINTARELILDGDPEMIEMCYGEISGFMSQMIRPAIIAKEGEKLVVCDFSAIEARVLAWLAGEQWRLDVFKGDGKIYEASASMMFNVPIDHIGKGSEYRQKGKIAELALGYQGSVGAMLQMGAEEMGLDEFEMKEIVTLWRRKNPNIVKLWDTLNRAAIQAVETGRKIALHKIPNMYFYFDGNVLMCGLPSKRRLFYQSPRITQNRWGMKQIAYKGVADGKWTYLTTYGGKLAENITQAVARDVLAVSMKRLWDAGFPINMHVHDESVATFPDHIAEDKLEQMSKIMATPIEWAEGLPLDAEGYVSNFYKKD